MESSGNAHFFPFKFSHDSVVHFNFARLDEIHRDELRRKIFEKVVRVQLGAHLESVHGLIQVVHGVRDGLPVSFLKRNDVQIGDDVVLLVRLQNNLGDVLVADGHGFLHDLVQVPEGYMGRGVRDKIRLKFFLLFVSMTSEMTLNMYSPGERTDVGMLTPP